VQTLASLLLVLSAALIPTGCETGSTQREIESLNELQKQVDAAIISGDTERYVGLIADDAVLMPPNAPPVIGKDAIRSWNREMSKQFQIQKYASVDDEVIVAGEWAFRRATIDWTLAPTGSGKPIRDSGKYIIIYRRQANGTWRVARDIWNSNTQMQ
jgi:ketosteroid isomerase-like protein